MNLTEHFADDELGVRDVDERLVENATFLCKALLEPIRVHFGAPLRVHDGYRDSGHNNRVGGKPTSWHLYENSRAAADFDVVNAGLRTVFDWVRLESKLPFDKVILETDSSGVPRCVHIQVAKDEPPRRQAYTGNVGNGKKYTPMQVL